MYIQKKINNRKNVHPSYEQAVGRFAYRFLRANGTVGTRVYVKGRQNSVNDRERIRARLEQRRIVDRAEGLLGWGKETGLRPSTFFPIGLNVTILRITIILTVEYNSTFYTLKYLSTLACLYAKYVQRRKTSLQDPYKN